VSVLQRKELEESPLADLHAIASELRLEGFRGMRREALIGAILDAQGSEGAAEPESPEGEDAPAAEEDEPAADSAHPPDEEEPNEVPAEESLEQREAEAAGDRKPPAGDSAHPPVEEPEAVERPISEEEITTGLLDILPNGSGFVRVEPSGHSRGDVYVSPAQIRRCELRAGDEVSGPVRPPKRSERHPSLVRIEQVNGAPAEPPEERPHFSELTPVFPSERLTGPAALEGIPYGKGSRVAIGGPPGAGATTLLREIASTLADKHSDIELVVVLAGVRPEEVTEWHRAGGAPVTGGGFDRSAESQGQVADLAVERAKRRVERGGDVALIVDSLEALPAGAARRVFGAARKAEEGGSLTVVASTGMAPELQHVATTRVLLDPPGPDSPEPRVSSARSATLRAELLG
jgi:transcription termination factor Rho